MVAARGLGLRFRLTAGLLLLIAGIPAATRAQAPAASPPAEPRAEAPDARLWQRAIRLTRQSLVIDSHSDVTSRLQKPDFDFTALHPDGHVDLPRMREGGLAAECFAIFTPPKLEGAEAAVEALGMFEAIHRMLDRRPDQLAIAQSSRDLDENFHRGKVSVIITMENGTPVMENRLDLLQLYYRLGARMIGLCHWKTNILCDSATDKAQWDGLSPWGEKVIREMNRLGIMVDVSHLADETVRDILALTRAPVIASHSCCRALCDSPRNLPDDLIRAISERDGVIQINFYAGFLDKDYETRSDERRKKLQPQIDKIRASFDTDLDGYFRDLQALYAQYPIPVPGVDKLVAHIEHVIRLAGVDHVGLGSDFDGISELPRGMRDCRDLPQITLALLRNGHSEADIKKILGGNFRRVMQAVEKAAAFPAGGPGAIAK